MIGNRNIFCVWDRIDDRATFVGEIHRERDDDFGKGFVFSVHDPTKIGLSFDLNR